MRLVRITGFWVHALIRIRSPNSRYSFRRRAMQVTTCCVEDSYNDIRLRLSPFSALNRQRHRFKFPFNPLAWNGDDILSLCSKSKLEDRHGRIIPRPNRIGYVRLNFLPLRNVGQTYQDRLYGVTNVQIYFYVRKYRRDRMMLKCAVALLWWVNFLGKWPVLESTTGGWIRFTLHSSLLRYGITLSTRLATIKLSCLFIGKCHPRTTFFLLK